jgi:hypothetical protein
MFLINKPQLVAATLLLTVVAANGFNYSPCYYAKGALTCNSIITLTVDEVYQIFAQAPADDKITSLSLIGIIDLNEKTFERIMNTDLMKNNLDNIDTINLSKNRFTEVPVAFNYISNLRNVNLQYNIIQRVNNESFNFWHCHWCDQGKKGYIDLSYNNIGAIDDGAFKGTFDNTTINLGNNMLPAIPPSLRNVMKMMIRGTGQIVNSSSNYICDCSMAWLVRDNPELISSIWPSVMCHNGYSQFYDLKEAPVFSFYGCPKLG